jgi:hypothetical protein
MGPIKPNDELDEFDRCSLCDRATVLLIMFRAADILVSVCGRCIEAQGEAYKEMMRKRQSVRGLV